MLNQMKNIILQKSVDNTKRTLTFPSNNGVKRDHLKVNKPSKVYLKNGVEI
jgi:hypothetical protein